MKKTISVAALIMAALMLMMCFTACGDDAKGSGPKVPAGTYTQQEVSGSGSMVKSFDQISATFEVNDDGTAKLTFNFMGPHEQDWVFEDGVAKVGDKRAADYTVSGDTFTLEDDGGKVVFKKQEKTQED